MTARARTFIARSGVAAITLALLLALALALVDRYVLALSLVPEAARPRSGPAFASRSFAMLASASLLVWGLVRIGRVRGPIAPEGAARFGVAAQLLLAMGSASLLALSPADYSAVVREDGPVESATFAAFLVAALVAAAAALRDDAALRRRLLAMVSFVFFLAAGEEISWGQRLFELESPEVFAAHNLQGETNLHNFATDRVEAITYGGVLLVFVVLPLVVVRARWAGHLESAQRLLPRSWVCLAAAPMAGLSFDQWDVIPVQLAFWTCLAVAIALSLFERGQGRVWAAVTALALVSTQSLHLMHGHRAARPWDPSELRELAIALLALTWSAWLWNEATRSKRRPSLSPRDPSPSSPS